jgi:hypothetical protein
MGGRISYGWTRIEARREGRLFAEPSAAGISATSFRRMVAGGAAFPDGVKLARPAGADALDNDWTSRRDVNIGRERRPPSLWRVAAYRLSASRSEML